MTRTALSSGVSPFKSFCSDRLAPSSFLHLKFPLFSPLWVFLVYLFVIYGIIGSGINIPNVLSLFLLILIYKNFRSLAGHVQLQILNSRVFSRRWAISLRTTAFSDKIERTAAINKRQRSASNDIGNPPKLAHSSPLNLDLVSVSS